MRDAILPDVVSMRASPLPKDATDADRETRKSKIWTGVSRASAGYREELLGGMR